MPPIREKVVYLCITATLSSLLLVLLISHTITEVRIKNAHNCGPACLTEREAEVKNVDYIYSSDRLFTGSTMVEGPTYISGKRIIFQTESGQRVTHIFDESADVKEGQKSTLGMWGDELVTFNGEYIYEAWWPPIVILFLFLPPFVVATLIIAYRFDTERKVSARGTCRLHPIELYPCTA